MGKQLTLNDWSRGQQLILFPSNLNVSRDEVEGNKIHCSPRDQSLSDLLNSKRKQKQNFKAALRFQRSRATAVNISRVTVKCYASYITILFMRMYNGHVVME